MKWYGPLLVGDSVRKKQKRIIRKVKNRSLGVKAFLICFSSNKGDLFDIIDARELAQKSYPVDKLRIIGISGDKDEAIDMITKLVDDTYQARGDCDVKAYLKDIWRSNS